MANVLDQIQNLLKTGLAAIQREQTGKTDRAMSYWRFWNKLVDQLPWEDWLLDIYLDDGEVFALVASSEGWYLRQIPLTIQGDDVILGEPIMVEETFSPVVRSTGLSIVREKGKKTRWIAIACTSLVNRVAEIDSSEMFQRFAERFNRGEKIPYLTIRHCGETFRLGECDLVTADGYTLVMSGTFDDAGENLPLVNGAIESLERDKGYWGTSIGFTSLAQEVVRAGKEGEIAIPVHTDGVLEEISILAENECASWLTQVSRGDISVMPNKNQRSLKEDLEKIFPNDPDKLAEWLVKVDATNRAIENSAMIRRDNGAESPLHTATDTASTPNDSETPEAEDAAGDIIIDDDVAKAIVADILASPQLTEALTAAVTAQVSRAIAENKTLSEIKTAVESLSKSVKTLTRARQQEEEDNLADKPSGRRVRFGNRPSDKKPKATKKRSIDPDEEDDERDWDDPEFEDEEAEEAYYERMNRAESVLATLP